MSILIHATLCEIPPLENYVFLFSGVYLSVLCQNSHKLSKTAAPTPSYLDLFDGMCHN